MKIGIYVNPNFISNGNAHGKVMFKIENLGYFGVFINGQSGKIEKQAYEWKKFHWRNVIGNCVNYSIFFNNFTSLRAGWKNLSVNHQEKIFHTSMKACEAFRYFIKKYDSQINDFSLNTPYNSKEIITIINDYVWYYIKFITALHNGDNFDIDPKFESGVFPAENVIPNNKETIAEEKTVTNTRKSIAMFKLINANNLENLFEGNFYPIVNTNNCLNGYITIKDNQGNEYTVRANRGKAIQVYTDCPA